MILPTRRMLHGLEAVLDIAHHGGDTPVQAGGISQRQGIPKRYLEPVLQQLVREGVLAGVRGPRGGYRLARERKAITVGAVVRALEGLETAQQGLQHWEPSDLGEAVLKPFLAREREAMLARLDETSLDDLTLEARRQGLSAGAGDPIDFAI